MDTLLVKKVMTPDFFEHHQSYLHVADSQKAPRTADDENVTVRPFQVCQN